MIMFLTGKDANAVSPRQAEHHIILLTDGLIMDMLGVRMWGACIMHILQL